ncbi:hypothetical protein [Lacibacter sediminis]|uniref:Uncharacterized protein n=1 Tax=Lacibacter sediminis TaxID=2760713 RepID=A0A7G5XKA2_9BACT|nr:hypothetical protein [Lacibacter sediminis]QNA45905.1 hypothetical protein H4075_06855 [Lacibacter sediminis]
MKKAKRYDRKSLKKRLSCIMMIHLDGLGPKQKEKMKKYLDDKISAVVDHYVSILKKKNLKMSDLAVSLQQVEKLCPETNQVKISENTITDIVLNEVTEAPVTQQ